MRTKRLTKKLIRTIRLRLGFTQQQLAQKIGSNRFNISNYETGRAIPPGDLLLKIQELESQVNE